MYTVSPVLPVGGRVSETVDWKKNHHDSLREMEADERRWRTLEELLRKLVARLCSVASGSDPRLETQLERLAVAVRSNADAVELKALFDSLTDAVRALERSGAANPAPTGSTSSRLPVEPVHPPAAQKRWETSCKALSTLLDRLADEVAARDAQIDSLERRLAGFGVPRPDSLGFDAPVDPHREEA